MKSLNLNSFAKAGNSELENIVSSVEDAKTQLAIGFLLKTLGEKMIDVATSSVSESFTIGHVRASFVKESVSSKPDFSGDEIHKSLIEIIKRYEESVAVNMPKKYSTKKAHYRFTITG